MRCTIPTSGIIKPSCAMGKDVTPSRPEMRLDAPRGPVASAAGSVQPPAMADKLGGLAQYAQLAAKEREQLALAPTAPSLGRENGEMRRQSAKENAARQIPPEDALFVAGLLLQEPTTRPAIR